METKSLILGLVLSIGIFAIKCGAGLFYLLNVGSKRKFQVIGFGFFVFTYTFLFVFAWLLMENLRLLDHLDMFLTFAQSGMFLHIIFALALLVWGIFLLSKSAAVEIDLPESVPEKRHKSRGWLLLVMPCPVCCSAVLCSVAFLLALFPDNNLVVLFLICVFFLSTLLTAALLSFFTPLRGAEHFLGSSMVFIALYFFLTISLVPQFGDIDRIYRLGMNRDFAPFSGSSYFLYLTVLLLAGGFIFGAFQKYLVKLCK